MKIKQILISQPRPKSEKSPYFEIEKKHNIEIDFQPFIKVEPIYAKEFREQKINILNFSAIIFNSRHGIDHFFRLAKELRITIPQSMKYFCVSETVAHYLQKYTQYRKRRIFFSPTGKFGGLAEAFAKNSEEKYLFITSNIGNEESTSVLNSTNIKYDKAIMYQTISHKLNENILSDKDLIIFFTPAGVTSLFDNFPDFEQKNIKIGCFGKKTAEMIKSKGLKLDLIAPTTQCQSITMALKDYLKETNKD